MPIDLLKAMIYGTVQGLTEFLPVSSSGHLVILHDAWPLAVASELAFDVALHLGTLLAAVYYFRRDLAGIAKSFFTGDKAGQRLGAYLALATVPAGLAGYFLEEAVGGVFRSSLTVVVMLAAVGALFIISERCARKQDGLRELKLSQAIAIGAAQALALIPGTSRSGITVAAGLFLGLKREAAARFSFLLSVPVIAGAALTQIPGLAAAAAYPAEFGLYLAAFAAAAVSGWWAIGFFLGFVAKNTLRPFAYYRFGLAALVLAYIIINRMS